MGIQSNLMQFYLTGMRVMENGVRHCHLKRLFSQLFLNDLKGADLILSFWSFSLFCNHKTNKYHQKIKLDSCTTVFCVFLRLTLILYFVHLGTPKNGKKSQCSFIMLCSQLLRKGVVFFSRPVTMFFFSSSAVCSFCFTLVMNYILLPPPNPFHLFIFYGGNIKDSS